MSLSDIDLQFKKMENEDQKLREEETKK